MRPGHLVGSEAQLVILIVASTRDVASMNIQGQLLAHYDFVESSEKFQDNAVHRKTVGGNEVKLVAINEEAIYYQAITKHFNPELIIYISCHSSKSGTPTLSVHTPGNLADAKKGGLRRRVSIAPANAMKDALQEMAQQKDALGLSYQVSYECTHHGPSINVPAMFVELGSSPKQWMDLEAAEAVAHAAFAAVSHSSKHSTVAVGIGGPHYSGKFTRMCLEGSFAFGHIIPKYVISEVDAEVVKQCVERTAEKVEIMILDWKGIRGADRARLTEILKEVGVRTQRV